MIGFAVLVFCVIILTLLPVGLFLRNLSLFQTASSDPSLIEKARHMRISVCIPARNEEKSIGAAIESLINADHPEFEVLVMDDHSDDSTCEIVERWMSRSTRVKLFRSASLPDGWNGKQHACWQLSHLASFEWLLFLDADVRLSNDALIRICAEQQHRNSPLISGFPRQETGTWSEKLLIPMMHYVLLCYLPLDQMRRSLEPGFAAGCGQLFFVNKDTYFRCGGHSAIKGSRHDGIQLPRHFRRQGERTDLFDATDLARCRMYESFSQVQRGLLKNATEGIANAKLIVLFTLLLIGGTWLSIGGLMYGLLNQWSWWAIGLFATLGCLSWLPRLISSSRFQQSLFGALCHPLVILWFVALQWIAFAQGLFGRQVKWRGRN